jgi:hypothetical protein
MNIKCYIARNFITSNRVTCNEATVIAIIGGANVCAAEGLKKAAR